MVWRCQVDRGVATAVAVCCTRKARPETETDATPDGDAAPDDDEHEGSSAQQQQRAVEKRGAVRDPTAVRALIASGGARLTNLEVFDVSVESFNMDEYFDYAVRLDLLVSFFKK